MESVFLMQLVAWSQVVEQVNWSAFLSQHDLVWSELPDEWGEGAILGNGLLGANIWAANDETLHWDLGRSDVYCNGSRIPIGKFVLETEGGVEDFSMRQSIWNAEAQGKISTKKGSVQFRSFVPRQSMVVMVEVETAGQEKIKH